MAASVVMDTANCRLPTATRLVAVLQAAAVNRGGDCYEWILTLLGGTFSSSRVYADPEEGRRAVALRYVMLLAYPCMLWLVGHCTVGAWCWV